MRLGAGEMVVQEVVGVEGYLEGCLDCGVVDLILGTRTEELKWMGNWDGFARITSQKYIPGKRKSQVI